MTKSPVFVEIRDQLPPSMALPVVFTIPLLEIFSVWTTW